MTIVTIHKAKTNLSRLIEKVCEGQEIVIAKGAKPVARLVPIEPVKGKRRAGSLKGKLHVSQEFFKPLPPSELAGWD